MPNGFPAHGGRCRERCHVHRFEDDIYVDMECRLEQEGEERGFLLCDQDAWVIVDVTVDGRLADHLCFDECVAVHIECYGPQDPNPIPVQRKEYDCTKKGKPITFKFKIPAGTLCDEPGEADCGLVCCFAVTMTSITKCGDPGHIMCVCKGPCV
ncbi:MAG: hypothetical protein R3293_24940, partial [Candidatus Promineifilaceae bacterium]|nr:hypothetical protein [Candidatus Promineifilaceae bacterium]